MPLRITSSGILLMTRHPDTKRWRSRRETRLTPLIHLHVDIEPGTTLGSFFDLVEQDEPLRSFIAQSCHCDVNRVHKTPRSGGRPILLRYHDAETLERLRQGVNGDMVITDELEMTGEERQPDTFNVYREMHLVRQDPEEEPSGYGEHLCVGLGWYDDSPGWTNAIEDLEGRFEAIPILAHLELRLLETVWLETAHDTAKFQRKFTLWEVLVAIYGNYFGTIPLAWNQTQRQFEEQEEFWKLFREAFSEEWNEEEEDWKKGDDED